MVVYEEKKAVLLVYTRRVSHKDYPEGLAYSVHIACGREGESLTALHQNYGILFAEAEISDEDTIVPKCVKNPVVFRITQGTYGILADRVEEDGRPEAGGDHVLFWKTHDFRTFGKALLMEKKGFDWESVQRTAGKCEERQYVVDGERVTGSFIEIDGWFCDRIIGEWRQVHHVENDLPDMVTLSCGDELSKIGVKALYSDGSAAYKKVKWNTEHLPLDVPGTYKVTGRICERKFKFPLAKGYGDPVVFPWEGKWYFLGTNDNLNDIGFYVRESDSVEGLFEDGVKEHLILGVDEERGFVQTFWAPEFHVIGGRLYILFAVGGKVWGPQCHMMRLKEQGHIICADDWEEPVKVVRADGSPLSRDGITLDMTYLCAGGNSYLVWSYRRGIGTPKDTGSMLYIARTDQEEPWRLTGSEVLLSRPLFGWENVSGTINNEGPHGFCKDGRVYLAYSGGAANGYTYVLGLLTAEEDQDLTDPAVWYKNPIPVLSFYSVKGEYGPGHHSFYLDEDGNLMIAYHGETALESRLRCDGIRRVHFGFYGEPVFDLSAERDLNPALQEVSLQVRIAAGQQINR